MGEHRGRAREHRLGLVPAAASGDDRLSELLKTVNINADRAITLPRPARRCLALGVVFRDVDDEFRARAGDISAYLDAHGYEAYTAENVFAYLDAGITQDATFALSSGW